MNPSLFFLVLRARFGLFALAVCATLISAAVVTLLMPKSYRATASLVIDHNQSQSLREGATTYMSNAERTSAGSRSSSAKVRTAVRSSPIATGSWRAR